MLSFSQCHHQYQKGHLGTDVTFTLSQRGLTKLCDDQNLYDFFSAHAYHPQITFQLFDQTYQLTSEEECSEWRKHVISFHEVSEPLLQYSIQENISLFYEDEKIKLFEAIQLFELQNCIHLSCENASFEQIMKMIFSRIYLRGHEVILFDTSKMDYTKEEYDIIIPLLVKLSYYRQVIVFDTKHLKMPYTREITIQNHHLLSDSGEQIQLITKEHHHREVNSKTYTMMMKVMHQRYSLPYHVLLLLIIISFFLVSILLSGSSMNVETIELSMLKKDKQSSIEIKRYASDNQGSIYQIDDIIQKEHVQELEKIAPHLIYSYRPINAYYANAYLEGIYDEEKAPIYNQYDVCELNHEKELGVSQIVGRFPTNDEEVMMSYQLASQFFSYTPQGMVGQKISWYGLPLTISGVFLDKYAQNDTQFYVYKGFMKQHPLLKMKVFPYGNKHVYYQDIHTSVSDFQELNPYARIYNGYKIVSASILKENEVILDISLAKELGFPYDEIASNMNMSYDEKLKVYYQYMKKYIGAPLKLRVDRLANTTIDTSYYQETKTIAGVLIPNMDIMYQQTKLKPSVLYFKTGTLTSYLQENSYITKVQYASNNDEDMKQTLKNLRDTSYYYADLNNALLLRLLVLDIKELVPFFIGMYLIFGILTLWLYRVLMKKTLYHNRKQIKLIYEFGESALKIRKAFEKRFLNKMKHYYVISLGVSFVLLMIYYFMIFIALSSDFSIFLYLFIPCLIYIIYGGIIIIVTKLYLYRFIERNAS